MKSVMIITELIARSFSTIIVGILSDLMGVKTAINYMLLSWLVASFIWITIAKSYVIEHDKVKKELIKRFQ